MMNRERLEKTVGTLLDVKEQNLPVDMDVWKCGAAACAFGHVAQTEWANEEGLSLRCEGYLSYIPIAKPVYKDSEGFQAIADFYEISFQKARELFSSDEYRQDDEFDPVTVDEVIERINQFLEEGDSM